MAKNFLTIDFSKPAIDLGSINFGAGPQATDPDYNDDYNDDYLAEGPEEPQEEDEPEEPDTE